MTDIDPYLSVVIPYRDEALSLPALHAELCEVLDAFSFKSEIIFVDDASRDEGGTIVRALAAKDRRVRGLSLSPRCGQSAALSAGFRAARGEIVATLDADLQNVPADLPRLIAGLDHADCVCGVRQLRQDPLAKRLGSRAANSFRRFVLSDGISDIGCSIRVMRASSLSRVKLFRGGHRFLPALLAMEGARIVELPVRHRARQHGASKYGLVRRLIESSFDLLAVYWMKRRTDRHEVKELSRRV
jgi:dolichol-phosphate mannosyltransferase